MPFIVPTSSLVHKVTGAAKLVGKLGGDWDRNFVPLSATAKHRSVFQRFVEGRNWEDTELFTDHYPRRIASGVAFQGSMELSHIVKHYYRHVDATFASLKQNGFRPQTPPKVLIARSGEVMLGNQGNHRVAMAKVLGIANVPCLIVCRHSERKDA